MANFLNLDETNLFEQSELAAYVANQPYIPGKAGTLFESDGISTTVAVVDVEDGHVDVLVDTARDAAAQVAGSGSSKSIPLLTQFFPLEKTIGPSDFQNVRRAGSLDLVLLEDIRNKRLGEMLASHRRALEVQRVNALRGVIDARGGAVNLFTSFGLTQRQVAMNFATTTTEVRSRALDAIEQIEAALGSDEVTGYVALCGSNFFRKLIEHKQVKDAYAAAANLSALRDDVRQGFEFGDIEWVAYRGGLVPADEAFLCPIVAGKSLFQTRFAPPAQIEYVNQPGLPVHPRAEVLPMGKGVKLLTESAPVSWVSKPDAVIRLHVDTVPA